MGKKSKRQPAGAGAQKTEAGSMMTNKAVCKLVDELWEKTQGPASDSLATLWQEYHAIQATVKSLKEKQGPLSLELPDRVQSIPEFEKWMKANGAVYDSVELAEFPGEGLGLRALKDLEAESSAISIPEKLMISTETAMEGPLGPLIAQDRILQIMNNAALVIHLIDERYKENSFWKPYIDVLPHSFDTPFYFSEEELRMLQSSPTLEKIFLQVRNITKLYAHLHRLIRTRVDPSLGLYRSGFHYTEFMWAVFCVMSRQNEIPSRKKQGSNNLTLIPLWDFCNHTEGHMTTFFSIDTGNCDCLAQQKVHAGEEFKIFYGPRSNADLFIHQGFVYPENQSDNLTIKLGLSAGEEESTKKMKRELLKQLKIPVSGAFQIRAVGDCPFSSQLISFVRVFTANAAQLKEYLEEEEERRKERLTAMTWDKADERVLDFLEKRCTLLLLHYKSTIEHDTSLLSSDELSPHARLAVMMRLCEKKMLQNAVNYAQVTRKTLTESDGDEASEQQKTMEVSSSGQEAMENGSSGQDQTELAKSKDKNEQQEVSTECQTAAGRDKEDLSMDTQESKTE